MDMIYTGRSTRKLTKKLLVTLIREHGISDGEFETWLDTSVNDFVDRNPRLRYETFKAQVEDYLQTGRPQPLRIKGGAHAGMRLERISGVTPGEGSAQVGSPATRAPAEAQP